MLVLLPALLILFFVVFDLDPFVNIKQLRACQEWLDTYYEKNPLQLILLFSLVHLSLVAFAMPTSFILNMLAGAVFGFSVASFVMPLVTTVGASLCFLISRCLLRNIMQEHFKDRIAAIDEGLRKDGAQYLLTLRLIPLFPFVFVNLAMGVTTLSLKKFFFVSFLGLLPKSLIYINAGSQLSQVKSIQNVLSPWLLLSFAIIGLLPLLYKALLPYFRSRRARPPKKFRQSYR